MSILNAIFGNPQPQQAAPQQQPQQQALQPASVTDNQTVPNAGNTPVQQQTDGQQSESPLDNYKDLWDTFGKQGEDGTTLTFDRTKLGEIANQMNFAGSINNEQLQAITSGGEDAAKALVDILNNVARQSYLNSTETTTHLLNNALKNSQENLLAKLPEQVKRMTVSDTLTQENPMFKNPAVKPILSALEQQLTAKYPDASAAEITQHAKQYLNGLSEVFNPQAGKPQAPSIPVEQDFSSWA